jgi:uncharacterized protein (UPF0335 family)
LQKDIDSLRSEFEQFVVEKCSTEEGCETDVEEEIPEDELPYFTEELSQKLLSPAVAGANLSRVDLKRISDVLGDSVAVKDRKKMLKAILRHKQTKEELKAIFDEVEKHLNGRVLIYREIVSNYPNSKTVFESYIAKIERMKTVFGRIIDDFEDISPDSKPIHFDDI